MMRSHNLASLPLLAVLATACLPVRAEVVADPQHWAFVPILISNAETGGAGERHLHVCGATGPETILIISATGAVLLHDAIIGRPSGRAYPRRHGNGAGEVQ
jgi:hypothetical protein